MKKTSLKITLTTCTALALIAAGGTALAADQPVTTPSSTVSTTNTTPEQAAAASREITIVNPESGMETVVNQTATTIGNGDHSSTSAPTTVWPEYFPPIYEGYYPVQTYLPAKVVTADTKPVKVKITYEPVGQGDLATTFVAFILDDIDGKEERQIVQVQTDDQGITKIPTAPAGWEYVNAATLPETFQSHLHSHDRIVHLLIQKKNQSTTPPEEVATKQVTRTIIFHLPSGDKEVTQTITATKKGGKWQIEPFEACQVPMVDGYTPSQTEVPALTLTADDLTAELPLVEVSYQPYKVDDEKQPGSDQDSKEEPAMGKDDAGQNQPADTEKEDNKPAKPETGTADNPAPGIKDQPVDEQDQPELVMPDDEGQQPTTDADSGHQDESEKPTDQDDQPAVDDHTATDSHEPTAAGQHNDQGNTNIHQPSANTEQEVGASTIQPVVPFPTNEQSNAIDHPDLGAKLAELSAPLNQLTNEEMMSKQSTLPQTGNQHEYLTELLGIAITAITALSYLFKFKKF